MPRTYTGNLRGSSGMRRGIIRSGFDMFVVGLGVAAVAYVIGDLLLRLLAGA